MKKLIALLLALTMVFALASCGGSGAGNGSAPASTPASSGSEGDKSATPLETTGTEPQYGGEVTLYYPKFYNYFDPAMMDEYQFSFWYETLWVMDWGLNDADTYAFDAGAIPLEYMAGQLADSWEFDQNAGTLTVKLRDGVCFQDGEPYNGRALTADDVVWSYSRLLGINGIAKVETEFDWANALTMLAGVEAVDDSTVVFTFADGMATDIQLQALMNAKVNIGGAEWDSCPQTWEYAKGTGPYVLSEYV